MGCEIWGAGCGMWGAGYGVPDVGCWEGGIGVWCGMRINGICGKLGLGRGLGWKVEKCGV